MAKKRNQFPNPRNVRFEDELWADVLRATEMLNQRENLDIRPAALVRRATRREVDEILRSGGVAA